MTAEPPPPTGESMQIPHSEDAGSLPQLEVVAQGLIFDASKGSPEEAANYDGSLLPLASGAILAGWQCGPEKHTPTNTLRIARSPDGGQSWRVQPGRFDHAWKGILGSFLTAEMVEVEPGRVLLFTTWVNRSDPQRPLFDPETEGLLPTRILCAESPDEGASWSAWREVATPGLTGCAVTGPVLRWTDGTIACAFESFKEYDDPTPVEPAAWLVVSRDGGRSFDAPWLVARHPQQAHYYWDQRLVPAAEPGAFLAMFWTHDRVQQRDLNVHMLQASIAEGAGAASAPVETRLPGQIAACGLTEGGQSAVLVVDRGSPGTLTLWQSADGGASWPEAARLVVYVHEERAALTQGREDIDYAAYWEDMAKWSFGHPVLRRCPDGWLLAWYAGSPDRMSIHWARVAARH